MISQTLIALQISACNQKQLRQELLLLMSDDNMCVICELSKMQIDELCLVG